MTLRYGRAGSGEPLLLLHSGVCDARMWDPQWEALAARFLVVRPDLRGFGQTPYEAAGPYSDVGDVTELLASLGLTRVAVAASSYGCHVALQLAQAGLVSRMVLLNPGSDLPATPDKKAFGAEENRLLELGDIEAATELNVRTWLGPSATAEVRAFVGEMQRHAFELQLAGEELPQVDHEVTLTMIDTPALVVGGGHDLPFFRDSARHVAASLPHARLVELEWAGHLPGLERPEEIAALLLDYL